MPPQTPERLTTSQFASWLKKQDPELASFPDAELVKGVLARRPDLRSKIIPEIPEQGKRMPLAETFTGQLQQAYEGNLPILNHWLATLSGLGSAARGTVGAIESIPEFLKPPSAEELQQAAPSGALAPTAILAGRVIKPIGQALRQAPEAFRALRDLPIEQIAPALQETAGQGAGQAITSAALDLLPKILPAGIRFGARGTEAIANQRLIPIRELIKLGLPADEAAAAKIRIPGRDIGLEPSKPSMQELTKQAVAEGRAARIPTKIKPEKPAAAPRKVTPPPVRYSVREKPAPPQATPPPVRYSVTRTPEPTPPRVSPPPVRYSVTGQGGPAAAPAAEEGGIEGSLPKGRGRLIKTPEEIQQLRQLYNVQKQAAHERGMAFAGGQVPESGRSVPRVPRPQTTVEWRGLRGPAAEAAIDDQVLETLRARGQKGLVMSLQRLGEAPELKSLTPAQIKEAATRLRDAGKVVGHTTEADVHGPGGIVGIAVK